MAGIDLNALCTAPCRPDEHGGPRVAIPGMALCDVCEERCAEDLEYLATNWLALERQLATSGQAGERVSGTPSPGLVINEAVSDALSEITTTLHFWTRVVLDENPGFCGPDTSTGPDMARWLAGQHQRLTRHTDHGYGQGIAVDARHARGLMRKLAYPSGARVKNLKIPCRGWMELGGETVHCDGTYIILIGTDRLPDMKCSHFPDDHHLTPYEWQRLNRSRKVAA